MTISFDSSQTLTMLGLSASQSKIYLDLITIGEATVSKVSKGTSIDRGETYRVMTKLVELGLVEKVIDSPLRFRAIPLETGLSLLFKRREEENLMLQESARNLIVKYFPRDAEEARSECEEKTIAVSSVDHNANLVGEKLACLKKEYQSLLFLREFDWFIKERYKDCGRLLDKGISLRFIVELAGSEHYSSNLLESLQNSPNLIVKFVKDKIPVSLSIYDNREVRIGSTENRYVSNASTYWSTNPAFVALAKTCFDATWNRRDLYPPILR